VSSVPLVLKHPALQFVVALVVHSKSSIAFRKFVSPALSHKKVVACLHLPVINVVRQVCVSSVPLELKHPALQFVGALAVHVKSSVAFLKFVSPAVSHKKVVACLHLPVINVVRQV